MTALPPLADLALLVVALLVTYLPGLSLLAALRVREPLLLVGLAPAVSVAVAGLVGVLTALLGLPYGAPALGVGTVLLAAIGAARAVLAHRRRPPPGRIRAPASALVVPVVSVLMVLVAAGVGVVTWLRAMRTLATVPQEHDMVVHAVLTAYIQRSGHGAPWQLLPADLLTGEPVVFYPSGLHLLTAVTASLVDTSLVDTSLAGTLTGDLPAGGTVVALNAMTVVMLAVVLAVSAAVLTAVAARQLRLSATTAALAAGVAALVAVGLYRPVFHLMHDGGILPNAVTLALTPAVVAGVLLLPRRDWQTALAVGIAGAGLAWVHPNAAISVTVTVLAWWLGQSLARPGRRQLRGLARPLLVAAGSAALLAALSVSPLLRPSAPGATGSTFPPDSAPTSLRDAVGSVLSLPYAGHFDPAQARAQVSVALLTVVGVVAVLVLRRGYGPVMAWAVWGLVTLGAFLSPGTGVDAAITGFFYHALLRTWSHVSLLVPVLAALGIVLTASLVAVWVRRHTPVPARPVAAVLVLAVWLGYLVGQAPGYAATAATAMASRYSEPHFVRVDADDQRAIDWLAGRVAPGQRVLNSANDGSTYLYVERGIPVVNVFTLGSAQVPHTYRLLGSFNTYPDDPAVRNLLLELDVAWVYVDTEAPRIGSRHSPEGWADPDGFSFPRGFTDLDRLPGLVSRFRSGTVTVYSLDLDRVREL